MDCCVVDSMSELFSRQFNQYQLTQRSHNSAPFMAHCGFLYDKILYVGFGIYGQQLQTTDCPTKKGLKAGLDIADDSRRIEQG